MGDWREEVIWRTADNLNLRIYTTTVVATNRFYTLMHDPQYRCAIAWQNTGYNQPPHPGFYLGPDMYPPPLAPVSAAQLAWRGGNGGNAWNAAGNWFVNGVWTNNIVTNFASGNSVLFDLRASNNTTITLFGTLDVRGHHRPSPERLDLRRQRRYCGRREALQGRPRSAHDSQHEHVHRRHVRQRWAVDRQRRAHGQPGGR